MHQPVVHILSFHILVLFPKFFQLFWAFPGSLTRSACLCRKSWKRLLRYRWTKRRVLEMKRSSMFLSKPKSVILWRRCFCFKWFKLVSFCFDGVFKGKVKKFQVCWCLCFSRFSGILFMHFVNFLAVPCFKAFGVNHLLGIFFLPGACPCRSFRSHFSNVSPPSREKVLPRVHGGPPCS